MADIKLEFVQNPVQQNHTEAIKRIEPSTCTEAQTFVLQVMDDSMEPEFAQRCMIVIDPTGHAKDGSYVFARINDIGRHEHTQQNAEGTYDSAHDSAHSEQAEESVENYQFRQLRCSDDGTWQLCALNSAYPSRPTPSDFSEIVGVIVQRAGTRRRYHKHYDQ